MSGWDFYPEPETGSSLNLCDDIVAFSPLLSSLCLSHSHSLPVFPLLIPSLSRLDSRTSIMSLPSICSQFEPYFALPDEKLHALVKQFRAEMEGGLNEYGHAVAMVPSFVTGVPDGSEQGYVRVLLRAWSC